MDENNKSKYLTLEVPVKDGRPQFPIIKDRKTAGDLLISIEQFVVNNNLHPKYPIQMTVLELEAALSRTHKNSGISCIDELNFLKKYLKSFESIKPQNDSNVFTSIFITICLIVSFVAIIISLISLLSK